MPYECNPESQTQTYEHFPASVGLDRLLTLARHPRRKIMRGSVFGTSVVAERHEQFGDYNKL